jgi:hypothetical protein
MSEPATSGDVEEEREAASRRPLARDGGDGEMVPALERRMKLNFRDKVTNAGTSRRPVLFGPGI